MSKAKNTAKKAVKRSAKVSIPDIKIYAIGIPAMSCGDSLFESASKYQLSFPRTQKILLDRGNQKSLFGHRLKRTFVIRKSEFNYSQSLNRLIQTILQKYDHAMIIKENIFLSCDEDIIIDLMENNEFGFITDPDRWNVIIISREAFRSVGLFDSRFTSIYWLQQDYYRRLLLAKVSGYIASRLNRFIQVLSKEDNGKNNKQDRELFIKKWGGIPDTARFIKPRI